MEGEIKNRFSDGENPEFPGKAVCFKEWGERFLKLEESAVFRSYQDRVAIVRLHLISFFLFKGIE